MDLDEILSLHPIRYRTVTQKNNPSALIDNMFTTRRYLPLLRQPKHTRTYVYRPIVLEIAVTTWGANIVKRSVLLRGI